MIDWIEVHRRVMSDFKTDRLIPHLIIIGVFIILGIIMGMYSNHNLLLTFVVWIVGFLVDMLIFRDELLKIFTKENPYVIEGIILEKIVINIIDGEKEYDELYFLIDVQEAFMIDKKGRVAVNYMDKEGEIRIQVPESMFLSLKAGDFIILVCEPDDFAWGVINGDEVIGIDE